MAVTGQGADSVLSKNAPSLPNEVLMRIGVFAAKINPEQHSWLILRTVSKLFRDVVEETFVDYYLRNTWISFDGGWDYVGELKTILNLDFRFERLEDAVAPGSSNSSLGRTAVFSYKDITPRIWGRLLSLAHGVVDMLDENLASHVDAIAMIRRLTTDLIPTDMCLEANKAEQSLFIRFDWRKYLTAVYGELKEVEDMRMDPENRREGVRFNLAWQIQLEFGNLSFMEALELGVKYTARSIEDCERKVRRRRQVRIAKHKGWPNPERFATIMESEAFERKRDRAQDTWLLEFDEDEQSYPTTSAELREKLRSDYLLDVEDMDEDSSAAALERINKFDWIDDAEEEDEHHDSSDGLHGRMSSVPQSRFSAILQSHFGALSSGPPDQDVEMESEDVSDEEQMELGEDVDATQG